jgi:tetratricopeptide (TPR) repeat protein/tRNA A-37 threonylcarbamoyl transferase component Bud32
MPEQPPEQSSGPFDTLLPTILPDSSPPTAANPTGGLAALARADQRSRWSRGERVLVEAYLEQFPQLSLSPEVVVELIYNEYLLRCAQGETISSEEFLRRFPGYREALVQKFAWEETLGPGGEANRNAQTEQPEQTLAAPPPDSDHPVTLGLPLPTCAGDQPGERVPNGSPEVPVAGPNRSVLETFALPPGDPSTRIMEPPSQSRFVSVPGFEILEELGRGGMGVVYKARHLRLKRIVALKMILAGAHASRDLIARFLTEAQAVAQLQHPHIVQIYEIGEQGGLPFFSLEFVEGGSLERELAGRPQDPARAAQRAEILARAMHVAHQKGIVHRDLKPGNILLTRDGTPKITDFGLAKDLGSEHPRTEAGSVLGTPSYMAPEQAFGKLDRIGPPTDVYALGAILYEMLTGRPPFLGATPMDTLLLVRTTEPVPVRRLQPRAPRDLETICSKCLQKDPGKRYGSAQDLADDLQRWLEHKPILARPAGFVEVTAKWVRRNRALAALLLVIFLSLLGGVVAGVWFTLLLKSERDIATWQKQEAEYQKTVAEGEREKAHKERAVAVEQKQRAEEQTQETLRQKQEVERQKKEVEKQRHEADIARKQAESNARLALENAELAQKNEGEARKNRDLAEERYRKIIQTVDRFFTQVSESTLLYEPGMEPLRLALLRQARNFYSDFLREREDDPSLQMEVGRSLFRLGLVTAEIEGPRAGIKQLRQALTHFVQLSTKDKTNRTLLQEQAKTWLQLGRLERLASQPKESGEAYTRAVELWKQLTAAEPKTLDFRNGLASSFLGLGNLYQAQNNKEKALVEYRQALGLRQELHAAEPHNEGYLRDLAIAWANLASVATGAEATRASQEALLAQRQLVKEYPGRARYRADLGMTLYNQANAHRLARQLDSAIADYQEAISIYTLLTQTHSAVHEFSARLAMIYTNLAVARGSKGQTRERDEAAQKAREILEELTRRHPDIPDYRVGLALHHANEGSRLLDRKDPAAARKSFQIAEEILQSVVKGHPEVPRYRAELASLHFKQSRLAIREEKKEEAVKAQMRAARLWSELVRTGKLDPVYRLDFLECCGKLGEHIATGTHPEEELKDILNHCTRGTEVAEAMLAEQSAGAEVPGALHKVLYYRALCLDRLGGYPEAVRAWNRALQLKENRLRVLLQTKRALSLAGTSDYALAIVEAGKLEPEAEKSGWVAYDLAQAYARAAQAARRNPALGEANRTRLVSQYQSTAVRFLRQAAQKGYFKADSARTDFLAERDFKGLRDRADYQELVAGLKKGAG